jgi:hypothetical protein
MSVRAPALAEDAEWLAETGRNVDRLLEARRAAGRPVTRRSVYKTLAREGRHDLWARLRAGERWTRE